MSYIRDLQDKVTGAHASLDDIANRVNGWRAHIQSCPKYQGYDADGARRDWLSTADAARILDDIARAVGDAQFALGSTGKARVAA